MLLQNLSLNLEVLSQTLCVMTSDHSRMVLSGHDPGHFDHFQVVKLVGDERFKFLNVVCDLVIDPFHLGELLHALTGLVSSIEVELHPV